MANEDLTSELLTAAKPQSRNPSRRLEFSLTGIQIALLSALFLVSFMVLVVSEVDYLVNTFLLLIFITFTGLWFLCQTAQRLGDQKLTVMGSFWLIKLIATLLLLYLGWMPQLNPLVSGSWGYDPQRYYQYSWDLVQQGWNPDELEKNYQGILYYYGAIFAVFGHNPVIPALINSFVTLLGTMFLIRCAYEFMPNRTPDDWRIAYLFLIPEVLWYDVMTSRETLMATLIIVATLTTGRALVSISYISLKTTSILIIGSISAILAVRTTMILPVLFSIILMVFFLRSGKPIGIFIKFMAIVLGITALNAGPMIQEIIGGYDVNFLDIFDRIQSGESIHEWESKSIGQLLVPTGILQSILFTLPRMILYLAAPLPLFDVSLIELISGSYFAWQRLMTLPTSVIILLAFPYVLAGSALAWRLRKTNPSLSIIPVAFWTNFIAIAGGITIIHERYRLMVTILLFACAWIGYTRCSPKMVKRWMLPWLTFLGIGVLFYYLFKLL